MKQVFHELKTEARYFDRIWRGSKTADIRRADDRDFQTGDDVILMEINGRTLEETGRLIRAHITHVLNGGDGLAYGYAMLSLEVWDNQPAGEE